MTTVVALLAGHAALVAQTPPASSSGYFGTPVTTSFTSYLFNPTNIANQLPMPTHRVVLADMNGDGLEDCVTRAGVSLATAMGSFLPPMPFPMGTAQYAANLVLDFAIADLNMDAVLDIVFAVPVAYGSNSIIHTGYRFASGNGTGGFGTLVPIPFSNILYPAYYQYAPMPMIGDVNGDTIPDLVIVTNPALSLPTLETVTLVAGVPTLVNTQSAIPQLPHYYHPALSDLNGDGCAEIVWMPTTVGWTPTSAAFWVLPAITSTWAFGSVQTFPITVLGTAGPNYSNAPAQLMFADINNDGVRDPIATVDGSTGRQIYWAPASSTSLLGPPAFLTGIHQVLSLTYGSVQANFSYVADERVLDCNGDGLVDILSLHRHALPSAPANASLNSSVELRLGTGIGTFASPLVTQLSSAAIARLRLADTTVDPDKDGDIDPTPVGSDSSLTTLTLMTLSNGARRGLGCPGLGGLMTPNIPGGPPIIGDTGFAFRLSQVSSGATAFLFASLAMNTSGPCGQPTISLAPGSFISLPSSFSAVSANPFGQAARRAPIPLDLSLLGQQLFAQWLVPDPTMGLGYALSPVRTYIVQ